MTATTTAPTGSYWRDKARPVIAAVIARTGTDDPASLRRELLAAYPFGERCRHPYKIWRDEIRRQLAQGPPRPPQPDGQLLLFSPPPETTAETETITNPGNS
jgi:hypothetical protein